MSKRTLLNLLVVVALVLSVVPLAAPTPVAQALSADIVISQVYGGGATQVQYTNDFVELFNRGTSAVSLAGWSIQYASATGTGALDTNYRYLPLVVAHLLRVNTCLFRKRLRANVVRAAYLPQTLLIQPRII